MNIGDIFCCALLMIKYEKTILNSKSLIMIILFRSKDSGLTQGSGSGSVLQRLKSLEDRFGGQGSNIQVSVLQRLKSLEDRIGGQGSNIQVSAP